MTGDRAKGLLSAILERLLVRTDYLASYGCAVVAQNADGTLELAPFHPRLAGLSAVPVWFGMPGVKAKIKAGGRVALRFLEGNPSKPVATVWDATAIESISFADGTAPIARVGDPVSVFFPPGAQVQGILTPIPPLLPVPTPLPPTPMAITSVAFGQIDSGKASVRM